jgi:hypothetical protein
MANDEISEAGRNQAEAEFVLFSITKFSLKIESFILAALFQETMKVPICAVILDKVNQQSGFKNAIMGQFIVAGSGLPSYYR